ncbi:hypothetical protein M1146_03800 [Patescibacteria group bacterium]|nr:hypothetical protein [Patescibacteria group bacterium]
MATLSCFYDGTIQAFVIPMLRGCGHTTMKDQYTPIFVLEAKDDFSHESQIVGCRRPKCCLGTGATNVINFVLFFLFPQRVEGSVVMSEEGRVHYNPVPEEEVVKEAEKTRSSRTTMTPKKPHGTPQKPAMGNYNGYTEYAYINPSQLAPTPQSFSISSASSVSDTDDGISMTYTDESTSTNSFNLKTRIVVWSIPQLYASFLSPPSFPLSLL